MPTEKTIAAKIAAKVLTGRVTQRGDKKAAASDLAQSRTSAVTKAFKAAGKGSPLFKSK